MRAKEFLTEGYKEIEFVCANPQYPQATSVEAQEKLFVGLKSIEGVIVARQDWGDGQCSLAAVYKDPAVEKDILNLAKEHGVAVDLKRPVSGDYVDRILRKELEGQIDEEEEPIKLSLNTSTPAKDFIKELYASLPKNPLNDNEVILYHTNDEVVMFDLKPSKLGPNNVHISFMRAYPQRAGIGSIGMRKLQELAAEKGVSLDLSVWQHGKVSPAALGKFYKKMGFKQGKQGLLIWNPPSKLDEVNIDNQKGKGAFAINQDVDHFGVRVKMKPSTFLYLARRVTEPKDSLAYLKDYIKQGGAIGSPYLSFDVPEGWDHGDFSEFAKVNGHEGRHRMMAVQQLEGDDPIEVHLFPTYRRAKNITPEWLEKMNAGMWQETALPQYNLGFLKGPLFSVLR